MPTGCFGGSNHFCLYTSPHYTSTALGLDYEADSQFYNSLNGAPPNCQSANAGTLVKYFCLQDRLAFACMLSCSCELLVLHVVLVADQSVASVISHMSRRQHADDMWQYLVSGCKLEVSMCVLASVSSPIYPPCFQPCAFSETLSRPTAVESTSCRDS